MRARGIETERKGERESEGVRTGFELSEGPGTHPNCVGCSVQRSGFWLRVRVSEQGVRARSRPAPESAFIYERGYICIGSFCFFLTTQNP